MKLRVQEPCMLRWVEIMAHTGSGGAKVKYGSAFFRWLEDQILMVEDCTYAGIYFRGDPDLPVPAGA